MMKADLIKQNKEEIKKIYETQMMKITTNNRSLNQSSMF